MYKEKIKSLFCVKYMALLVSLILVLSVLLGNTWMYLTDSVPVVVNTFNPGRVTSDVVETLEDDIKKDVAIKNSGNTDAYIRAAIVVTWKNEEGEIWGETKPVKDVDYTIVTNEVLESTATGSWILGKDGFYYWTAPVAPFDPNNPDALCTTGNLIESCSYLGNAPEGYHLSVEILGSAIQSRGIKLNGTRLVEDAWDIVEVDDETLLLGFEQ